MRTEPLESRRLLTLLGITPGFPLIFFDSTGHFQYTAATEALDVTATPLSLLLNASSSPSPITSPAQVDLHILVDNSGHLIGGNGNPDFALTGTVDVNGSNDSGTLLTGKILQFGYQFNSGTSTAQFDFSFQFTGGLLQPYYTGNDIGVTMVSENSNTFTGSFQSDFSGGAKGEVGPLPAISSSQQPAAAFVGQSIADMATVTGLVSPSSSDTVTFNLYSSGTTQDTSTLLFTNTQTVSISGSTATATSASFTAAATGTAYWVDTFNGDSNNSAVTSGPTAEPVNIDTISSIQQPAAAFVGQSIADMATVTGLVSPSSSDTVTFNLYSSATTQDSSTLLFTNTQTVSISGSTATATSASFTAAATGTDYWVATFNGDSNNSAVTSGPTAEPVNVDTISSSQQPAAAFVGQSIADTATVTGLVSPSSSDTVTFNLYSSGTTQDSSTLLFTNTQTVSISGSTATATSASFTAAATGTDYWVDTFNGDSNNSPVTSGPTAEPVNIDTISSSQQPAAAFVGQSIADEATVTGLVSPSSSDTVTFNLYSSATTQNSSTLLFTNTQTVSISGSTATATSSDYTAEATGTDYWVATFNGDSNNSAVTSGPTAEPVNVDTISSSQQPAAAFVGQSIADTATVTGLVSPSSSDTVTFNLYSSATTQNSSTLLFTNTQTVSISGSTATATSASYLAADTGTDYWVDTFNGDSNNSAVTSGPTAEPVNIDTISSIQRPAAAFVGQSIADMATVTGLVSASSSDTVTFNLYNSATTQNSSTLLFTNTQTVSISGSTATATSASFTAAATGTDYWVATFNGDSNNSAVTSAATAEPVNIDTISSSQQPAAAYVGQSIADKATVTGLVSPSSSDTVTFNLYSSGTTQDSGTLLFSNTQTVSISGSTATATSASYTVVATGTDYWVATFGGDSNNSAVTSGPTDEPVIISPEIVISMGKSPLTPHSVEVIDPSTGAVITDFVPYANNLGGVSIATGDVSNNGTDDIVTAPGRGNLPIIKIYSQTGTLLTQFQAYPSSVDGGVQVAVADVDGDGLDDIITVPSYGPAEVRVFRNLGVVNGVPTFDASQPYRDFLAFPSSFIGGAVVAAGDMGSTVNGKFVNTLDGKAEIVVGSGAGRQATVEVFDVSQMTALTPTVVATPVASFNPFSTSSQAFQGGVSLDVAPFSADSIPDIVVGAGANGRSLVQVWGWNTANATLSELAGAGSGFPAFTGDSSNSPIQLTTLLGSDGIADAILVVQGPGGTTNQIVQYDVLSASPLTLSAAQVLPGTYVGPYFIAAINIDPSSAVTGSSVKPASASTPATNTHSAAVTTPKVTTTKVASTLATSQTSSTIPTPAISHRVNTSSTATSSPAAIAKTTAAVSSPPTASKAKAAPATTVAAQASNVLAAPVTRVDEKSTANSQSPAASVTPGISHRSSTSSAASSAGNPDPNPTAAATTDPSSSPAKKALAVTAVLSSTSTAVIPAATESKKTTARVQPQSTSIIPSIPKPSVTSAAGVTGEAVPPHSQSISSPPASLPHPRALPPMTSTANQTSTALTPLPDWYFAMLGGEGS